MTDKAREREAFEAWFKATPRSAYESTVQHCVAWAAWHARSALAEPSQPAAERRAEAAEADARRYRWLREQNWFDGALCVVRDPKTALTSGRGLGADCPSLNRLDDAIDAAIAVESVSTPAETARPDGKDSGAKGK
jgi:hypothetical protein